MQINFPKIESIIKGIFWQSYKIGVSNKIESIIKGLFPLFGMNKMDRVIANMIIKKGKFAIEEESKITKFWTNIFVDDEVTQIIFFIENKKENKMFEFRNTIAEQIATYRKKGKIVNPFQ